jgi:hypothetical protein
MSTGEDPMWTQTVFLSHARIFAFDIVVQQ